MVDGWSSTRSSDSEIEIDIPSDDEFFHSNIRHYKYLDGQVTKDEAIILKYTKSKKMQELNKACDSAIMGNFTANIQGADYQFSNDSEAQMNFEKCDNAFFRGRISSISWTAYDTSGNVVRLTLNVDDFETVYMAHLNAITGNISKFRDVLQAQVENATTVDEVNSITW